MTPIEIALGRARAAANSKAAAERDLLAEWEATQPELTRARNMVSEVYAHLGSLDGMKFKNEYTFNRYVYLNFLYHPGAVPREVTRDLIDGTGSYSRWGPCVLVYFTRTPRGQHLPYQQLKDHEQHVFHAWVFWEKKHRGGVRVYNKFGKGPATAAWGLDPTAAAAWLAEAIGPGLVVEPGELPPVRPPEPVTLNLDIPS